MYQILNNQSYAHLLLQDLAHSVLAGDLDFVKNVLKSNRKLNINIKNLVSS